MKRVDLIRHIETNGCAFLREVGRHTVYVNPTSRKVSTVPRHREINDFNGEEDLSRTGNHRARQEQAFGRGRTERCSGSAMKLDEAHDPLIANR